MTAGELIEELRDVPQGAPVRIWPGGKEVESVSWTMMQSPEDNGATHITGVVLS